MLPAEAMLTSTQPTVLVPVTLALLSTPSVTASPALVTTHVQLVLDL